MDILWVGGTDLKGIVKIGQYELLNFWIRYAHISTYQNPWWQKLWTLRNDQFLYLIIVFQLQEFKPFLRLVG